jgi:YD repeat-containing protein
MFTINLRSIILLTLICALLLSACGGDSKTPTPAPATSTPAPTLTPTLPPAAKYTYDNAGRLTQVEYPNGAKIIYTYDKAGNLISQETKK